MRVVLLVLAFPVALGAYLLTGQVLAGLSLDGSVRELLLVFLPLFVGGLAAVPFIAPFIDMKAKQALADAPSARATPAGRSKREDSAKADPGPDDARR